MHHGACHDSAAAKISMNATTIHRLNSYTQRTENFKIRAGQSSSHKPGWLTRHKPTSLPLSLSLTHTDLIMDAPECIPVGAMHCPSSFGHENEKALQQPETWIACNIDRMTVFRAHVMIVWPMHIGCDFNADEEATRSVSGSRHQDLKATSRRDFLSFSAHEPSFIPVILHGILASS